MPIGYLIMPDTQSKATTLADQGSQHRNDLPNIGEILSHWAGTHSIGKPTPGTPFLQHCNLHICLEHQNKQALSEWEAFTNLLSTTFNT